MPYAHGGLCPMHVGYLILLRKAICVPNPKARKVLSLRHSRQTNLSTAQTAITIGVFSKILLVIAFCVIKLRSLNNFSSNLAVTGRRQSLLVSIARSFS